MHLQRPVDDTVRHLARVELRHRGLLAERPALVLQPRRLVDEVPRRLDLGRHVGEPELHGLEPGDRPAELLALLGVGGGEVVGALGEPDPIAATEIRPPSRISRNWLNPSPRGPSRFPSGTAQSRNESSRVSEACQPIFSIGAEIS